MYKRGRRRSESCRSLKNRIRIYHPYDADFRDDEDTRFERVKDLLHGFPGVKFVTENMSKEYPVLFHKIEQMAVKEPWHRARRSGRDAVHAGAPTFTGAAMAIEDAIVLSEELQNTKTMKLHVKHTSKDGRSGHYRCRISHLKSSAAR